MIYLVCDIKSIIMTELVDTYVSALSEPWHKKSNKKLFTCTFIHLLLVICLLDSMLALMFTIRKTGIIYSLLLCTFFYIYP